MTAAPLGILGPQFRVIGEEIHPRVVKLHALRHSAADNLWRASGNPMLAQQVLRHQSAATTQAYLHPTRDDLSTALANLEVVRSAGSVSPPVNVVEVMP